MQSRLGRTMRPMAARLYALPGSHPSVTAELTLQRKGIDYRRLDLVVMRVERGTAYVMRLAAPAAKESK